MDGSKTGSMLHSGSAVPIFGGAGISGGSLAKNIFLSTIMGRQGFVRMSTETEQRFRGILVIREERRENHWSRNLGPQTTLSRRAF